MTLDEIKLWAMDGSGNAKQLPSDVQMESEQLLEKTLVNNPDMLMSGLTLVGRQTPTEGGPLDLLGVDEDGRLVVFELKRGTLSREAVAQVIDYASYLQSMPDQELANYISRRSGSHGIAKIDDFSEWYEAKSQGQELSALKPVRMVLVGLGVDDTTTRMVRFLAKGVDIALLTFHGYAYECKTLLARQVQVEAVPEPVKGRQGGRISDRRQRRELLEQRIEQHTAEWPQARELWDAVLEMFRENFPGVAEVPGGGASDRSKHRLNLRLPGARGFCAAVQLGPFDNYPELVMPFFYPGSVNSCLPEFAQIRRDVSPYWTYPHHQRDMEARDVRVGFPIKSLAEWEERKEKLTAVTRSVYEARLAAEDGVQLAEEEG